MARRRHDPLGLGLAALWLACAAVPAEAAPAAEAGAARTRATRPKPKAEAEPRALAAPAPAEGQAPAARAPEPPAPTVGVPEGLPRQDERLSARASVFGASTETPPGETISARANLLRAAPPPPVLAPAPVEPPAPPAPPPRVELTPRPGEPGADMPFADSRQPPMTPLPGEVFPPGLPVPLLPYGPATGWASPFAFLPWCPWDDSLWFEGRGRGWWAPAPPRDHRLVPPPGARDHWGVPRRSSGPPPPHAEGLRPPRRVRAPAR
jgi:hypothetical protein